MRADVLAAFLPRRPLREVVLVGAADALKGLRLILILPLITHSLGVGAYGVWTQVKVSAALLTVVALLGINKGLPRYLSGGHQTGSVAEHFNSAVCVVVASALVIAILLAVARGTAATLIFGDPSLSLFVIATALYLLLESVDQLAISYLQATRQVTFHAMSGIAEVTGEITAVWAAAAAGATLTSVIFAIVGWKAVVVFIKLGRAWHQAGIAAPRRWIIQRYLAFGVPLMASGFLFFVLNYADRFFISAFLGIGAVGVYAAAYAFGCLPIVLCAPVDYVMYPAIASHWNAGRMTEAAHEVGAMLRWVTMLMLLILAELGLLLPFLMSRVASPTALPNATIALVVAVAFAIFSIGVAGERILGLANRQRMITALCGALAAVNAGLNLILIPRFGLIGAAVATLVSFALYTTATLAYARKHCRFQWPVSTLWRSVTAALVAGGAGIPIAGQETWRIVLTAVVIAVTYALTLLVLRMRGWTMPTPLKVAAR